MTNEAKGVRFYQKRGTCLTVVSFLNMILQIMLELSIPSMYVIINFVVVYISYLNVFFFSCSSLILFPWSMSFTCFHGLCSNSTHICQIRLIMYMLLSTSCSYGKS